MNQQHVNLPLFLSLPFSLSLSLSLSLTLSLSLIHSPSFWHTHKRARTHTLIKVLRGPRTCQMMSRQRLGFYFAHGHQLKQYTVYAHGPKLNNEAGMAFHACFFISEVIKETSTKKKNEHGDICLSINYRFLCIISFKIISFLFL